MIGNHYLSWSRRAADVIAVAMVASLPWSTSGTTILTVSWLILVLPTLSVKNLGEEIRRPRSLIGLAVIAALVVSIAWSVGNWRDVLVSIGSVYKFLALPILICHIRDRPVARYVLRAYLVSVGVVLALSWASILWPSGPWGWMNSRGVATRDYGVQNVFFVIAAFALAHFAWDAARDGRRLSATIYALLTAAFVLNIAYVQVSRTTLIVLPVLAVLFAWQRGFGWRALAGVLSATLLVGFVVWTTSETVRTRIFHIATELSAYQTLGAATSSGLRIDYYVRSLSLLARSPILGYGAGGTREAIRADARELGHNEAFVTSNPHNQILWFGMQLGAAGVVLAILLWLGHARGFRGGGTVAMIGVGVVAQNVVYGQLNSHLTDYTTGWTYVFVVGTLMALADGDTAPTTQATPRDQKS